MSTMRFKMLPTSTKIYNGKNSYSPSNHWVLTPKMRKWMGVPSLETLRKLGFEGGSNETFDYLDTKIREKDLSLESSHQHLTVEDRDLNWIRGFNLSNLKDLQAKGVHWFYSSGRDFAICTCGLFLRGEIEWGVASKVFGHRSLPDFGHPVFVLIVGEELTEAGVSEYRTLCQLCKEQHWARDLGIAQDWLESHLKACPCVEWVD